LAGVWLTIAESFAPAGSWLLLSGFGQSVSLPVADLPHAVPWLLPGENAPELPAAARPGAAVATDAAELLSDKPAASAAAAATITADRQREMRGRCVRFIENLLGAHASGGTRRLRLSGSSACLFACRADNVVITH
jgi:hypothetical protein